MLRKYTTMLLTAAIALPGIAWLPSAHAAQPKPGHAGLVPTTPRTDTPFISNGEITDIEYSGNRAYVVGTFTQVRSATGADVSQPRLAAFDMTTGQLDMGFRPTFDGAVVEVEASPDGTGLYAVGAFNTVNGITKRKVVKLDPATGATVTAFTANAGAKATSVEATNTTVYVGGQFKTIGGRALVGLAALNPMTGAVDQAFNNSLSGGLGLNGLLTVQSLKLTHDDAKLLVVHTGRQIAGQDRYGAGLIDTATKQLLPWRTRLWEDNLLFVGGVQRAYGADISPDDSYFVVTSGSGGDRPPINDTAMAFPINGGASVDPLWVSRHFDSVYSVAITETAVYVGGHFRFQEAPGSTDPWPGQDNVGYGWGQGAGGLGAYVLGDEVVRRDTVGALDPATGWAMNWNPGTNSFEGVKAMKATPNGLIIGGDGSIKGGATVGRIGYFDTTRVTPPAATETWIDDPFAGSVIAANQPFDFAGRASAIAGVSKVQIEIRETAGAKRYLQDDLTTWGTFNTIDAALAVPGATETDWTLPVSLTNGTFQVWARTFSNNGSSDSTKATAKFESRLLDDVPPNTAITSPPSGLQAATTFAVTGTASDDHEVVGIGYWVRNELNHQYLQDDGTFGGNINTFSVEPDVLGATTSTWQTELTLPEGEFKISASARDSAGQSDLRGGTRIWIVSPTGLPPTVAIEAPAAMVPPTAVAAVQITPGQTVTFSGVANDETRLQDVKVSLRNTTTGAALAADGTWGTNVVAGAFRVSPLNMGNVTSYNWTYTSAPLTPGTYDFRVSATDNLGLRALQGRLALNVQVPGDLPPNATLNFTGTDQNIEVLALNIAGNATDDFAVASVGIALRDLDTLRYLKADGTLQTQFTTIPATLTVPGATATAFSLSLNLPIKGEWSVAAYAIDSQGQQDLSTAGATAKYLIYPGDLDPGLEPALGSPNNGDVLAGSTIVVGGRAIDDFGISRVEVQITNSANQSMNSSGVFSAGALWIASFLTSPGTPGSNFAYTTPLIPVGTYTVSVRSIDNWGQVQQTPRVVTVTVGP